ncbi:hypothetical protein MCOR25_010638 [Pyricularia grisea]|uniref:BZIP domain-containing protein n=1 Tax=Pyricularia grisea TaxID=148305 RepID=A0A6P8BD37_PYRGI|nr:uncharacterized protein PgNI_03345 [Pyricularia grisea]KAI6349774.1 hypothetical protein MCOR25_010638 [Pyricularia grisea]TLD13582.1 hypothetical protein PgNI_03345 [Pyricularia grisea]
MAETAIVSKTETKSPKRSSPSNKAEDPESKRPESNADTTTKPLAPPPRPVPAQGTPDYFNPGLGGSLSLEPNPFEQSFGAPPETPGGTKLPSVAALTSPSSLLPGSGATPFNWGGGSLRTGPLSPAMLSGPTNDYFGDTHHLRGGFPTPNESSLRTGLTPGGGGSMFPAASPSAQAFMNGGTTPSTLDFHRTALAAAAAKREAGINQTQNQSQTQPPQQQSLPATSQPEDMANGNVKAEAKPAPGPFDPHDNDAANGLFMLAQGRNGAQPQNNYAVQQPPQAHAHAHPPPPPPAIKTSPHMNTVNGTSGAPPSATRSDRTGSVGSDDVEQSRPSTRGKASKKSTTTAAPATNGKRKRSDAQPVKAPNSKQVKANGNGMPHFSPEPEMSDDDEDEMKLDKEGNPKGKQTDEEKRKNFLERNRVAALKCRQRKKQWLANLQSKVEMYGAENENLTAQIGQLREEVVNLKTLLLAHKDCNVTQAQGLQGQFMQQPPMDHFNAQMNPYGLAPAGMPPQPVIANGGQRRYS